MESELNDKQLYKKAKGLGIEITEEMTREDVFGMINKIEKKNDEKKEKEDEAVKGDTKIKYLSNGTFTKYGIKWRKNRVLKVSEAVATDLLGSYPTRFKLIKPGKKKDK